MTTPPAILEESTTKMPAMKTDTLFIADSRRGMLCSGGAQGA
jgi:hypothetical protein